MPTPTLVSKTGSPIIELEQWVNSKNDPALSALFLEHLQVFTSGKEHVPTENPAIDSMFDQFFAETNQELVMQ